MNLAQHWPVAPLVLSLGAGTLLVALANRPVGVQRAVAGATMLLHLACALVLFELAARGPQLAYAVGDWPAPFGIFLVVDRLAAWMLLLAAAVGAVAWLYSCAGEDRLGPYFHALVQFQLLGIQGAFLTGDLFNLFVFFEILLIASYALLLHGPDGPRARATVHVATLNLVGSLLFLIAVGCIYAAVGTLNYADLANKAPAVPAAEAGLLQAGAFMLLVVFALKAAALPLGFWLAPAYAAAPAASAVLFALLTKVGVYGILRLYTLVFPCFGPGPCGPSGLVLPLGLGTLLAGTLGALAAARLRSLSGHLMLISIGTLLVAVGTFRQAGHAAAIYYLAHSTLAGAGMFLVADLVARQRLRVGDRLDVGEPVRETAWLAALFGLAAVAIVGLPPLSGFLGKVAILQATEVNFSRIWSFVLVSTLVAVVVAARAASALFWRTGGGGGADVRMPAAARLAALGLAALLIGLTLAAGPLFDHAHATARQLLDRRSYVEAVFAVRSRSAPLAPPAVPGAPPAGLAGAAP